MTAGFRGEGFLEEVTEELKGEEAIQEAGCRQVCTAPGPGDLV